MNMIKKMCLQCGKTAWHNPCASKDRDWRCTYCGSPCSANHGTAKREHQELIKAKQIAKARSEGAVQ